MEWSTGLDEDAADSSETHEGRSMKEAVAVSLSSSFVSQIRNNTNYMYCHYYDVCLLLLLLCVIPLGVEFFFGERNRKHSHHQHRHYYRFGSQVKNQKRCRYQQHHQTSSTSFHSLGLSVTHSTAPLPFLGGAVVVESSVSSSSPSPLVRPSLCLGTLQKFSSQEELGRGATSPQEQPSSTVTERSLLSKSIESASPAQGDSISALYSSEPVSQPQHYPTGKDINNNQIHKPESDCFHQQHQPQVGDPACFRQSAYLCSTSSKSGGVGDAAVRVGVAVGWSGSSALVPYSRETCRRISVTTAVFIKTLVKRMMKTCALFLPSLNKLNNHHHHWINKQMKEKEEETMTMTRIRFSTMGISTASSTTTIVVT